MSTTVFPSITGVWIVGGTSSTWPGIKGALDDQLGTQAETASVTMSLAGVSFNIAANNPSFTRHVGMALKGVSFNVSTHRTETGAGTFRLQGVSFNVAGSAATKTSVTMSLNGVTIAAFATDITALTRVRNFHVFG